MYTPKIGQVFQDKYRILSQLGAGGMGLVMRAEQLGVGRIVALKFLKESRLEDPENVERFYRECKLLSTLSHPGLMMVYGMALADESTPYAVCEYIDGKSLSAVLSEEGSLHWERAVKIAIQIAEAMGYAHDCGVIHRDLKPDNILLLSTPEPDFVKLIDFGLAKAMIESQSLMKLTQTGQLVGTANYMSPEIVSSHADQRSDIYSLGCVMFEMISGEPLFTADSAMGVIFKHCNENENTRVSQGLAGKAPAGFHKIISRMLKKDPKLRYKNMRELLSDLKALPHNSQQLSGHHLFPWKVIASLAILLLVAYAVFSQFISSKTRPVANKYYNNYKKSTLPKNGDSMAELLNSQKSNQAALELSQQWLDNNFDRATVRDIDKLRVLYLHTDLEFRSAKVDPVSTLKELREMERLLDLPSIVANKDSKELIAIEHNFVVQRLLFFFQTKESIQRAKTFLSRISNVEDLIDSGGAVQQTVKQLIALGEFEEASAFDSKWLRYYLKNPNVRPSQWYFTNMGDIALCQKDYAAAKSFYMTAYRNSLVRIEGINTNAVTEAYMASELGVEARSRVRVFEDEILQGLPELAYRVYFFDKSKGRQLFKHGFQLMQIADESNSDVFTYMDSDSLSRLASFMGLSDVAAKILERSVDIPFLSGHGAAEPQTVFERQVALVEALVDLGKLDLAKSDFEKYKNGLMTAFPSPEVRPALVSSFAARVASKLCERGRKKEAEYYYTVAKEFFALSELKTVGCLADMAAVQFAMGNQQDAGKSLNLAIAAIPDYSLRICTTPGVDNVIDISRLAAAAIRCDRANLLDEMLNLKQVKNDCRGISEPVLLFAGGKEFYKFGNSYKAASCMGKASELLLGRDSMIIGLVHCLGLQVQARLFLQLFESSKQNLKVKGS